LKELEADAAYSIKESSGTPASKHNDAPAE